MAKIRYRVNPNRKTLNKKWGPKGYTVKLAQKPRKGKKGLWIVTTKGGGRPAGGGGPGANTPPLPDPSAYDPYGIKKATQYEYGRIDAQLKKHQQWAGDVRKLSEQSLQTLYNAREASNNSYQERLKGMATTGQTNGNAPQVSGSGGTSTAVTDPNQGQTNANNVALQQQDKALRSLAALQGQTALANNTDYIAQHLKGYDYYTSQLPALYNEAKAKYTENLTKAIMDIEEKKELANIQANASMYGAQQQLLGQLASVQGADNRALIQALSGQYAVDQNNATRVEVANANNASREQIEAGKLKLGWAELKADAQKRISEGNLNSRKWQLEMWSGWLKGTPVKHAASGQDLYLDPVKGTLLTGAVLPGSELLKSRNVSDQARAVKGWMDMAVNQLGMSKRQAYDFIKNKVPIKNRKKVFRAAGVALGFK